MSIIGGGAAGLTAAIAAARLGAAVTLFEQDRRVGRKILASGNGRCNLSNREITAQAYNAPDFVEPVLRRYPCEGIVSFFGGMGLLTYSDDDGRVYPSTNSAASVLDVLRLECAHLGVEVRCETTVERLARSTDGVGFDLSLGDGDSMRATSLVVTPGGGSPLLEGVGHASAPHVPVLGPLRTDTGPIRGLSGVRVRCAATLLGEVKGEGDRARTIATERGELLFRDYGVSGIMVFDLSRYLEPGCVLSIDLMPEVEAPALEETIARRRDDLYWRTAETFFSGMLHDRVARAILRAAEVVPSTPVVRLPAAGLARTLKDLRIRVLGVVGDGQAQVTRGGARVEEFDPYTLESRRAPGLFAAGEVLDVDGRSGGYNLQWAWASGIVAGEGAARATGVVTPDSAGALPRGPA